MTGAGPERDPRDMAGRIEDMSRTLSMSPKPPTPEENRQRDIKTQVELLKSAAGLLIRDATAIDEDKRYMLAGLAASYNAIHAPTSTYAITKRTRALTRTMVPDITVEGWGIDASIDTTTYTGRDDVGKPITKYVNTLVVRPDYRLNSMYGDPAKGDEYYFEFDEDKILRDFARNGIDWVEPAPETYQ